MPFTDAQPPDADTLPPVTRPVLDTCKVVFVLLSSSMVRQPFALATPLHLLDFEVAPKLTLLQHWIETIPVSCNDQPTETRVMLAPEAPAPTSVAESEYVRIRRDRDGYRGPGGALIDACEDLSEDTLIVVLESARVLFAPIMPMIESHVQTQHDITVVTSASDQPVGITITNRATIEQIPRRGYIDLKEQWITQHIRKQTRVFAHRVPLGSSVQIRNRSTLLAAMAQLSRLNTRTSAAGQPVSIASQQFMMRAPDGNGMIQTDGTAISGHPSAPGSYIMQGADVSTDAVLARCVVFPGARVGPNTIMRDVLIGPNGCVSDEQFLAARRRGGRA